ncbi:MAG: hypothetical protein K6E59_03830 [Bacilli bacterium]|nr:hypothetical protein [Bacilli bacterium]
MMKKYVCTRCGKKFVGRHDRCPRCGLLFAYEREGKYYNAMGDELIIKDGRIQKIIPNPLRPTNPDKKKK